MSVIEYKYNPGFTPDEELLHAFVVRDHDLSLLLDVIVENTTAPANRHVLVIGPRGLGKTTLARAVAATIRLRSELSNSWYPIVYGEESYNITSTGEFWLECLYHLQKQEENEELERAYYELRTELQDRALQERCLRAITDFSGRSGRKILVFVENLNSIFDDQINESQAWSIRHTLQNCREVMLFATATTYFDQIGNSENALFEQFKIHYLTPLNHKDCRRLWIHVLGQEISEKEIRPIQILTGGNPRLVRIWAEFAADKSFRDAVAKLSHIVDEYTDYFRGQLEALPTLERKVFVSVLELWDPSSTKEIAELARISINSTSSLLSRLEKRGAILRSSSAPPRWHAAERLFNIYYLMRRRGTASSRVQALVKFMTVYYRGDRLVERATELAREACSLEPELRQDHYAAFAQLLERFDPHARKTVFELVPTEFLNAADLPDGVKAMQEAARHSALEMASDKRKSASGRAILHSLRSARKLAEAGRFADAEKRLQAASRKYGQDFSLLYVLATMSLIQNKLEDAERHARAAVAADSLAADGWILLGRVLRNKKDKLSEAIDAFRKAVALRPENAETWEALGETLGTTRARIAEAWTSLRKATKLAPARPSAWMQLGQLLDNQARYREAEVALKKAVSLEGAGANEWGFFGDYILRRKHDLTLAEHAFREVVRLAPKTVKGRLRLATVLGHFREREEETRAVYAEALKLSSDNNVEALIQYSGHLKRSGESAEAERLLRQATAAAPNDPDAWSALAELFVEEHRPVAEVEETLRRAVRVAPNPSRYWEKLAKFLSTHSNRDVEVEEAFKSAVAATPEACGPLHSLGAYYAGKGRNEDAQTVFRSAIDANPGCQCALMDLAKCIKSNDSNGSELSGILQNTLESDPNNSAAHFLLGKQLWDLNRDLAAARAEFLTALREGGPIGEIWHELASVILQSCRDADACQEELSQALRKAGSPRAWNIVAWAIHKAKRVDLSGFAVRLAQRAANANPEFWAFRHTMAAALVDAGELDRALELVLELSQSMSDDELGDLIELCVDLAKAGQMDRLLALLGTSKNVTLLEPLLVSLRIVRGETIQVAEEIRQVAQDLVGQIMAGEIPEPPREHSRSRDA
jgi:tetratricopeptide (TPR) repeat protein